MNATLRTLASSAGIAAVLLALGGCGEDKKPQNVDADAGDQGPPKTVVDKKLAAAVKAAESAQAASKAGTDGPPETGVFGPGLADKSFAPGSPPKIEIVTPGAEPRIKLTPAPGDEQKVTASVTVRIQNNLIPVEYSLALKVDKPKDEKKDDKKADAPVTTGSPGGAPRGVRVVGKVTAVGLPSQISRDGADRLGKLKGTEIRYTLAPNGAILDGASTLPKDADPGMGEGIVKGLLDSIAFSMPAFSADPVGAGGMWMVTDRASAFGVEMIRYRVFKVEKIDKDSASLSVDIRAYAVKDDTDIGGQKLTLVQFQDTGKGKVDWAASALAPLRGEVNQRTLLGGTVGGGQQATFQGEVVGRFTSDDKKADDKKK